VFFFQAEDGIRDPLVTGVQTCALPIFRVAAPSGIVPAGGIQQALDLDDAQCLGKPPRPFGYGDVQERILAKMALAEEKPVESTEIGRASCRERAEITADDGAATTEV